MPDPSRLPRPEDLGPDPEFPDSDRTDYLMQRDQALPIRRRRPDGAPLRVVVAGGGPAAIEAVLTLNELAEADTEIRLLAPQSEFHFRPLSVTEPFANGLAASYPLSALAELGVVHIQDGLAAVDAAARTLRTAGGETIAYDALVVATGARHAHALPHALTFGGPASIEPMHGVVQDLDGGWSERIAFVAPPGANWTVPLYELALQTAERAHSMCLQDVHVTLVTHEAHPLEAFGREGSLLATRLLAEAGVDLVTSARPSLPRTGRLVFAPGLGEQAFDRVIALPVPEGRSITGLPADGGGFLPVDGAGRVSGAPGVYAAGDGCNAAPIKQGGLATQQADTAVETLLADAGLIAAAAPAPPQLRAMLITGTGAHFLRLGPDGSTEASDRPLWWPPSKIAGKRLAPFLDALDGELDHERVERRLSRGRGRIRRRAIIANGQTRFIPKEGPR